LLVVRRQTTLILHDNKQTQPTSRNRLLIINGEVSLIWRLGNSW